MSGQLSGTRRSSSVSLTSLLCASAGLMWSGATMAELLHASTMAIAKKSCTVLAIREKDDTVSTVRCSLLGHRSLVCF